MALSPREAELVRLLKDGRSYKEVAILTQKTAASVKTMAFRLWNTLGLSGQKELIRWAYQHPEALLGEPSETRVHPPGCLCQLPACLIAQTGRKPHRVA